MSLQEGVVLDLTGLETGSLSMAGKAIAQVQSCIARNRSVIVVVSASRERAARDLADANRLGATADPAERARVLASGPLDAAGNFVSVLAEASIHAVEADQALWPVTRGHPLDAEPRHLSAASYRDSFAGAQVVVVPGGVGVDDEGRPTSLGADTAPLTALFIGDRLALPVERPADGPGGPGDGIGRRKARAYAQRHAVEAETVCTAPTDGTRIALIGASSTTTLLTTWLASLEGSYELERFTPDPAGAAAARDWTPDVVVDLSESAQASYDLACWALRSGRTVITTNTAMLAERGGGLDVAALVGGGTLRASGAVAGCPALAPIIERSFLWPGVRRVQGAFSPLADRTLDLRCQGLDEEEAERIAAAELGLTPADAARARTGQDAMTTLAAVAQLAFGAATDGRPAPRGPAHVSDQDLARARTQGRRYRVIATAERIGDQTALRVGPVPLREDDPLVNVETGAVEALVETRDGAVSRASGRLHQPGSVAAAVLRDLIETRRAPLPGIHASSGRTGVNPTLGATA